MNADRRRRRTGSASKKTPRHRDARRVLIPTVRMHLMLGADIRRRLRRRSTRNFARTGVTMEDNGMARLAGTAVHRVLRVHVRVRTLIGITDEHIIPTVRRTTEARRSHVPLAAAAAGVELQRVGVRRKSSLRTGSFELIPTVRFRRLDSTGRVPTCGVSRVRALYIFYDESFCPAQLACHSIFFLSLGDELQTLCSRRSLFKKFVLFLVDFALLRRCFLT